MNLTICRGGQFMAASIIAGLSALAPKPAVAWVSVELYNHFFLVNPIKLCDDNGTNCAVPNYFYDDIKKIYKQADTLPIFLPQKQLNSTLLASGQPGVTLFSVWPTLPPFNNPVSPSPTTINAWFARDLSAPPGKVLYGEGFIGGNGVAYNTSGVANYSASGRVDTVAHELGHNFGLTHGGLGAGGANNLMTAGSSRSIPSGPANISPDGSALDKLTAQQIAKIQASPLTIDLPFISITNHNNLYQIAFSANAALAGVSLNRVKLDLSALGQTFTPGSILTRSGDVSARDISTSLSTDGKSLILDFANHDFAPGDALTLAADIGSIGSAAPPPPVGMLVDFDYNIGFGVETKLDFQSGGGIGADSWNIGDVIDSSLFGGSGGPDPFFSAREVGIGTLDSDPQPAPEPASIVMLLAGLVGLRQVRRAAA
jgi:hypothetical protein